MIKRLTTLNKSRRRNTPEYDFHCQVADTLDKILDPNLTCWSSVENSNHTGGTSGMIKQGKDRRKGVKSGVPDVVVQYNSTTLWLELKAGKGRTTPTQDLFHKKIKLSGNNVEVIRSINELMGILLLYQVPTLIRN